MGQRWQFSNMIYDSIVIRFWRTLNVSGKHVHSYTLRYRHFKYFCRNAPSNNLYCDVHALRSAGSFWRRKITQNDTDIKTELNHFDRVYGIAISGSVLGRRWRQRILYMLCASNIYHVYSGSLIYYLDNTSSVCQNVLSFDWKYCDCLLARTSFNRLYASTVYTHTHIYTVAATPLHANRRSIRLDVVFYIVVHIFWISWFSPIVVTMSCL